MPISVNIGGAWKNSVPWCNIGGTWKKPSKVFNNVAGAWKEVWANIGVWSSGDVYPYSVGSFSGCGTKTAALMSGGVAASVGWFNKSRTYNGTSWSTTQDLLANRGRHGSCGTQTAGVAFCGANGGSEVQTTEKFNGTSWSSSGAYGYALQYPVGFGTQSAGVGCGGSQSSTRRKYTRHFNGSTWASGGSLNAARNEHAGCGIQSAGLVVAGYNTSYLTSSEKYNGTSFSLDANIPTGTYGLGAGGTQSDAVVFGGFISGADEITTSYEFNGTVFSVGGNLIGARNEHGACGGSLTTSLAVAGVNNDYINTVEQYTKAA